MRHPLLELTHRPLLLDGRRPLLPLLKLWDLCQWSLLPPAPVTTRANNRWLGRLYAVEWSTLSPAANALCRPYATPFATPSRRVANQSTAHEGTACGPRKQFVWPSPPLLPKLFRPRNAHSGLTPK